MDFEAAGKIAEGGGEEDDAGAFGEGDDFGCDAGDGVAVYRGACLWIVGLAGGGEEEAGVIVDFGGGGYGGAGVW